MNKREVLVAGSQEEVLAALADGNASVLAGGQSLIAELADPGMLTRRLVDINRVPDFDGLTHTDGVLRVAPLVRHRTFERQVVPGPLGVLSSLVVRNMGHPPVRARGTVLGSLANAHPAAEWTVLATVLDARFVLASAGGSRTVTADRFYTGPFTTVRKAEELLAEVRLPALPPGTGVGYAEKRRGPGDYASAAAMVAVTVAGGLVTAAAIGLVNAGPCPVRARTAEKALLGTAFTDAAISAAAEAAADVDVALHDSDRRRQQRAFWVLTRRALTQARDDRWAAPERGPEQ